MTTRFISDIAKSEKIIDTGIFSAVATNQANRSSKSLNTKLLGDIARGDAQEFSIGNAFMAGKNFLHISLENGTFKIRLSSLLMFHCAQTSLVGLILHLIVCPQERSNVSALERVTVI